MGKKYCQFFPVGGFKVKGSIILLFSQKLFFNIFWVFTTQRLVFILEILMKLNLALASQSLKKSMTFYRTINHKPVLNHLHSICESLLKLNEIEPFLKLMLCVRKSGITYDKNGGKRSFLKLGKTS